MVGLLLPQFLRREDLSARRVVELLHPSHKKLFPLGNHILERGKFKPRGTEQIKKGIWIQFTLHLLTNTTLVHACLFYAFAILSSVLL